MTVRCRQGLAGALVVCLAGCATGGDRPDVIAVCDSGGCYEAPGDAASFDPAASVPDPDPSGLLAFLEAEAAADPRAAHDLGLRLMRGDGVRRDPWQALGWMRDAAERGEPRAQAALGRLYLTGLEEMGPDPAEAEAWLSLAADRGDADAAMLLDEARAARAEEVAFQTALRRFRQVQTEPYWYRAPYYGRWRHVRAKGRYPYRYDYGRYQHDRSGYD